MAGDMQSLLLEMLASRAAGGSSPSIPELVLSQLDQDDPAATLLARYLAERGGQDHEEPEPEAAPEPDPEEVQREQQAREAARAASLRQLRATMESMYSELTVLRDRNDAVAAALGACYLCWGDDINCVICGGSGSPGWMRPDPEALAVYVAPVLARYGSTNRQGGRKGKEEPRRPGHPAPARGPYSQPSRKGDHHG